ncbi:hypothetical protein P886_4160 [Alteromonadaceae bacterium 2753L.S.0a.02]|nr:hypothetical protein P886_4160 [Alteromonadaceae bacterium 2753L.S.0a.02]
MTHPPVNTSKNNKIPPPFSLRFTFEERAALEKAAGDMPLGSYIKHRLFHGDKAISPRLSESLKDEFSGKKPPKQQRAPRLDEAERKLLGKVLGYLGKSRLSSNVNQLAKAANSGSLPVNIDVEKELMEACQSIRWMRDALIKAMGLNPSGGGVDAP